MNRKTRAQQDLILAEQLVSAAANDPASVRKIYGGLCHSFPVTVRTCGLCQALAFSEAKSQAGEDKDRKRAHALLLEHVGKILGSDGDVLGAVRKADVTQYMVYTRRVLDAWIYFKRFAESILKVKSARDAEEAAG